MNAHERAERLYKRAEKIGLDAPTDSMIAEAIHDAECDALNFPHRVNALGKPSDFVTAVKMAVGRLAEHAARDLDHYGKNHKKWYKSVERVRSYLQMDI